MLPSRLVARIAILSLVCAGLPASHAAAQTLVARITTGSYAHAVTVDAAANRVYVASYSAGTVSVIDALTNAVVMTIPISGAWDVGLNPNTRRLYVSRDYVQQYIVHDADTGGWLASVGAPRWAREIAVNPATNRVYVSNVFDHRVRVFDGTTNQELAVIPVSGWLFDLAVDEEKNLIYAANYSNGTLTVIDGTTNTVVKEVAAGTSGNSWSVAVNRRTDKIYLTKLNTIGGGEISVIDRSSLTPIKTLTIDGAAGVAVNERTNRIFLTLYLQGALAVLDGETDTVASVVPVGGIAPERVAVHEDLGLVYVTDGFTTNTVSVFQDILPNGPPSANAGPDPTVECAGHDGTSVTLDGSASSDPDGDPLRYEWRDAAGGIVGARAQLSLTLPVGEHTFILTVTDDDGAAVSDSVTVTVRDTTPPVIATVSASPSVLWPPDGRMAPVTVSVSFSDACDAGAACRIVEVTSSEPAVARGSGQRSPDSDITGALTARLRAERSGNGAGRTYTIAIECGDASGNVVRHSVEVLVPHDRRR